MPAISSIGSLLLTFACCDAPMNEHERIQLGTNDAREYFHHIRLIVQYLPSLSVQQ